VTTPCLLCGAPDPERVLDLGRQSVSTHFTRAAGDPVVRHPLALAICRACRVVQLAPPFPFRDLVPPYDWITYREPESHLDLVTGRLLALEGLRTARRAAGVSFKDDTTLARLGKAGVPEVWRLDLRADLGATEPRANIESVPGLLTPGRAAEIVAARGPVDLLIARHVVEHAGDPRAFLAALGTMLAPGGHLVIEVPDCRANLERQDYTMLWEEHSLYFTPETAGQALAAAGCAPVSLDIHPFPFEDVIVLVGRKLDEGAAPGQPKHPGIGDGLALARSFGAAHAGWSRRIGAALDRLASGRKLAAYGAGHLACAFLNFHGVADRFAFVVDDTPQKQGLFLPGSGVPIVPREALARGEVRACLFGLAPEIEDKVIARNPEFVASGGVFCSMFADSPRSLRRLMPPAP
jgi:hypothetical protein